MKGDEMPDRADSWADVDRYIEDRQSLFARELAEFVAIPSEASNPDGLKDAGQWIARRLAKAGANVEVVSAGDAVPDLVVGECGAGSDILIAVNHYDVQPAEPTELWASSPYEP